jgi:hypothetical protein
MPPVVRLRSWMRSLQERRKPEPHRPAPAAAIRRNSGLGEQPAAPTEAAEAELDTLRGELVRELDRLAAEDDGSASFRRIAS